MSVSKPLLVIVALVSVLPGQRIAEIDADLRQAIETVRAAARIAGAARAHADDAEHCLIAHVADDAVDLAAAEGGQGDAVAGNGER